MLHPAGEFQPGVIHAFGKYLEALGARKDFLNPDPRWINIFSNLAFKAARGVTNSPPEGPHLLHCAQSPIADQLAEYFNAGGGASKLRILSPFYDPNADAVRALAAKADWGWFRLSIEGPGLRRVLFESYGVFTPLQSVLAVVKLSRFVNGTGW
jgi:hypothetical protein